MSGEGTRSLDSNVALGSVGSLYKTEPIGGKGLPDRKSLIGTTSMTDVDSSVALSISAPMSTLESNHTIADSNVDMGAKNSWCNREIYVHRGGCSYQRLPVGTPFPPIRSVLYGLPTVSDLLPHMLIEDVES